MTKTFSLSNFPLEKKTVLLRVDYNVPLSKITTIGEHVQVLDTGKIEASLPTIKYLLLKKCKIILATHLGRPEGKVVESLKTDPLVVELQKLLPKQQVIKLDDSIGKQIKKTITSRKGIFLLENLRFYHQEEENDPVFAHSLASLADVYINDAFADCHRKHASIHAITKFLPSLPGMLIEKELHYLRHAVESRQKSLWILGGGKLDKVSLVELALEKADYVLIGGVLAFPFLKAKGLPVGMSLTDAASVQAAKRIFSNRNAHKIILPIDFRVADNTSLTAKEMIVPRIPNDKVALDIGPETIQLFKQYLRKVHTVIWNGPLGYFELAKYALGTKEIGRYLGMLTATTIIGGGETAEAIRKFNLQEKMTHVSTGGGAFVAFLTGKDLPGIVALEENYQSWKKKVKTPVFENVY